MIKGGRVKVGARETDRDRDRQRETESLVIMLFGTRKES